MHLLFQIQMLGELFLLLKAHVKEIRPDGGEGSGRMLNQLKNIV